jgi:hypothetical protein
MDLLERVADELAREVLELSEKHDDPDLVDEIKKIVGTSSTTLEEAYMTSVRVRRAEKRALEHLVAYRRDKGGQ